MLHFFVASPKLCQPPGNSSWHWKRLRPFHSSSIWLVVKEESGLLKLTWIVDLAWDTARSCTTPAVVFWCQVGS